MFDTCITIFNYDSNNDIFIPFVINNSEFQPIYKTDPQVYDTKDLTSCLVIIPYNISKNKEIYIITSEKKLYYLSPKEWGKSEDKTNSFTIQTDVDFIAKGNKSFISGINLNDMKNNYDDVFVINKIKNFSEYPVSHFELTVN